MSHAVPAPKLLVFDVNETLLDLAPLEASVAAALGGREDLVSWWFSTMLHYSLVETLTERFHDFGEIGAAALCMVAEGQGIALDPAAAKAAIVPTILDLPPHADVIPALDALSHGSVRRVALTNSSQRGVDTQLDNAGLTPYFERRYSVEAVGKYKPHPATYRMVLDDLEVTPGDALMVAAHPWDLAGAHQVGMRTAFLARPGKALYPNVPRPDFVVKDLGELVAALGGSSGDPVRQR